MDRLRRWLVAGQSTFVAMTTFLIIALVVSGGLSITDTPHILAQNSVLPTPTIISDVAVVITPATTQVFTGGIGATRVVLHTNKPVSALTFKLSYDPAIISVLDADLAQSGTQVRINPELIDASAIVRHNRADNTTGIIEVELSDLPSRTPQITIVTITWWGRQEGVATLSVTKASLVTGEQEQLKAERKDSTIQVTAAPEDPIIGRVLMEGRSRFDGTIVYAAVEPCPENQQPEQPVIIGTPVGVTDSGGYFEIIPDSLEPPGCIQVTQQGYLVGQRSIPQGNLGTIILPGGDTNSDNIVNIFDLAFIGSRYGDDNTDADINIDGIVNIFDLVIAANNYGLAGPADVWR
jgi:hypothetical protein